MRRAVLADEAGAVEAERHGQVLQADIVDELVVGALRERRIERDDGVHARGRHAGGQRHRVLLGDADVEEALRVRLAGLYPLPLTVWMWMSTGPSISLALASTSSKRPMLWPSIGPM